MLGRVSVFLDTQCLAWLLPAQRLTRKCHPKSTLSLWHNESAAPMIVEQHKTFLGIIPEGSGDVATQWIVFASGDGVPGMVWTLEKVFLCAALCSRRQPELEAQKQSTALVNSQTEGSKSLGKLQNCFITAFHNSSSRTPSWNFISKKKTFIKIFVNAKSCSDKGAGVKRGKPICDQVYMVVLMILVSTLLSGWPTLQTLYMEGEQFHRCNHHKKITKTLNHKRFSLGPSYRISRVYKWYWTMWVAMWLCLSVITSKMIIISAPRLHRPL